MAFGHWARLAAHTSDAPSSCACLQASETSPRPTPRRRAAGCTTSQAIECRTRADPHPVTRITKPRGSGRSTPVASQVSTERPGLLAVSATKPASVGRGPAASAARALASSATKSLSRRCWKGRNSTPSGDGSRPNSGLRRTKLSTGTRGSPSREKVTYDQKDSENHAETRKCAE